MESKLISKRHNQNAARRRLAFAMVLTTSALAAPLDAASVSAWGYNGFGEVGDGSNSNRSSPVSVSNLSVGVTVVAAGGNHSLAVRNGALWAWGYGGDGELANGSTTTQYTPLAVSGMTSGVTAIAGGFDFSLAVQNGAVWSWGDNASNQLGDGTTTTRRTPVAISGLGSGVTAVAAGATHSLALQNGSVMAWGSNSAGNLGDGTRTNRSTPVMVSGLSSGVTAIAAGGYHSLAIKNGAALAWGSDSAGQLGDASGGPLNYRVTPFTPSALNSGVTSVAAGYEYSLAVKNGNVWAWGANDFGELGDGTMRPDGAPEQIDASDLHDIVAVAAGHQSSYALSSDGSLWAWGANASGELGVGTTSTSLSPQHLLPPSGYVFTSIDGDADGNHVVATVALAPEPTCATLLIFGGITLLRRRRRWRSTASVLCT